MKMKWLVLVAFALFATATPRAASATSFILNCTLTSQTTCPAGGPFGTVTINDNVGNPLAVDFVVALTGAAAGQTVSYLGLNYTGLLTGTWTASGGNISSNTITTGTVGAFARFDIRVDPLGNVNPLMFTLFNSSQDLNASAFNLLDQPGGVYLNVNAQVNGAGTEFRYGSTCNNAECAGSVSGQAVPEPATLVMLGSGLVGLALGARRLNSGA